MTVMYYTKELITNICFTFDTQSKISNDFFEERTEKYNYV